LNSPSKNARLALALGAVAVAIFVAYIALRLVERMP
jgi:hypothetical protein